MIKILYEILFSVRLSNGNLEALSSYPLDQEDREAEDLSDQREGGS